MPFCAAQIVYSNEWTGQTSAISSTSVYTTTAAALYRITVALSSEAASSGPSVTLSLEPVGNGCSLNTSLTEPSQIGADFVFVGDGSYISLSTSVGGSFSGSSSSAYLTIEQLA